MKRTNLPEYKLIGAIVMASGSSSRWQSQKKGSKLLADFHGQPLLSSVLSAASSPLISHRIAVTRMSEIRSLCAQLDFPCLLHDRPLLSDTIRLGLEALCREEAIDGCLFFQGDQPLLSRKSIESLILAFSQNPDMICRLSYDGQPGSPVLFPRKFFPELLSLPQNQGGSAVIRSHPDLVCAVEAQKPYELLDADTPEELERLLCFPWQPEPF